MTLSSNSFCVHFLLGFSRSQKKLSCSLEDLRSESVDKVRASVTEMTELLSYVQHNNGIASNVLVFICETFAGLLGQNKPHKHFEKARQLWFKIL